MRRWSGVVAIMVGAGLQALISQSAAAAVRSCLPGVTSEITQGETELVGKRKALVSWTAKAAQFGVGYTSWRTANKKILGCKKDATAGKGYQCIAYGVPCTIVQAPGKPKRGRKPNGRNPPIDI